MKIERKAGLMSYTVDIVFCIDTTVSMEDTKRKEKRLINVVKEHALHLYHDIMRQMDERNKKLAQLRIRVVSFRDFIADGKEALTASEFYLLPQQQNEFKECIDGLVADGGGDPPEDGLEALATAMRSEWTEKGTKKRQVIVLWTDAGTHEIGYGRESEYYPDGMPKSMAELEDWWDEMDQYAKRLIIFAPDAEYWNYIRETWNKVVFVDVAPGKGVSDRRYDEIVEAIVNSFAN